jgi:hypothetical protein
MTIKSWHIAFAVGYAIMLGAAPVSAGPKCATPQHPDICAKLIHFLDRGHAEGLLSDGQWDPNSQTFHISDQNKWRIKVTSSPDTSADPNTYNYNILQLQTGSGTLLQRMELQLERSIHTDGRIITLSYNDQFSGAGGQTTGPQISFDSLSQRPTEDRNLGAQPTALDVSIHPDAISVQDAKQNHPNVKIDKTNINTRFVTPVAGDHIAQNERAFMIDSNGDAWSCKVSSFGIRRMTNQNGQLTVSGHAETLHFQSRAIAHLPGNHAGAAKCLISVHK